MKYTFFVLCLSFVACKRKDLPIKEIDPIKEYQLDISYANVTITEYTIDGCQYIGHIEVNRDRCYLTHKGNCANAIHKQVN